MTTTRIDPITDGIHRISTYVPEGPPGGITFNQFLVLADEPLLVHTGMRGMFPAVRDAVASAIDLAEIRWISSCHASRPDEYGSLDLWEQVAAAAVPAHGFAGCFLCLNDLSSRVPRVLGDGVVMELGGHRVRWLDTPHVPGPWEAGVLFEEETRTLFCGDLFARTGPADTTTTDDVVDAAIAHDQLMHGHAVTANTGPTLRRLADLEPARLALMHGPTFVGDGAAALRALAGYFDAALMADLQDTPQRVCRASLLLDGHRTGDADEVVERAPELFEACPAEHLGDVDLRVPRRFEHGSLQLRSFGGQANDASTAVVAIDDASEIPALFHVPEQVVHRLLGDLQVFGDLGRTPPLNGGIPKQVDVSPVEIVEPLGVYGCVDAGPDPLPDDAKS